MEKPKTDAEYLAESRDQPHIFRWKLLVIGELALKGGTTQLDGLVVDVELKNKEAE